jgi:signal transduction histidine kinase/ActR/RegA family two-component response regulator
MEALTDVELRRCVRDLFALSALPALWRQGDVKHTTETLADAVFRTLEPDLAYVLVPDSVGTQASLRTTGEHDPAAIRELLTPIIEQRQPTSRLDLFGIEMNVLLQAIDLADGEQGAIIVAARRSGFGSEINRALLRVAVNQAAVALQNARYVAELGRAARVQEELVQQLASASRRKDQFLAILGHELRNPLAAIHAAHAHSFTHPEHGQGRTQEIISHQLATLIRLVDDLLDLSRVSTGKIALQRQRLNLRDVVEKARAALEHAAIQKGHHLVAAASNAPIWVDGDAVRLEQVLVNLLGNAIRYTPRGGRISIAASRTSDGHALIRVEDNGCGIAPELLPNIFEPFVQAEISLHRTEGGLGLGLAIVKGVVVLHGGSVAVTSTGLGKGCTVMVRLPLVEPQEQPGTDAPTAQAERPSVKLRVLLVDDNTDMTEMLAASLEASGHETASANDGLEALEVAGRFSPDVAFVDIGLPSIDGYEVARRLRAQLEAPVVLIAMSGYGQEEDRALSREAGFDDHFVKPVPRERIEQVLAEAARSQPLVGATTACSVPLAALRVQ